MRLLVMTCLGLHLCASSFNDIEPSTPDEIVSLHSGLLIDGYVSASSGQIVMSEIDLCVKGAQSLCLSRTYVAPQILGRYEKKKKEDLLVTGGVLRQLQVKGWVTYPHLRAGYNRHSPYFQVRDPQGFVLEFEIQGNQGVLRTPPYGCSNLCGENPSSTNDIRNIVLKIENNQVRVAWPDGTERYYSLQEGSYFLQKELLPNGKAIYYESHQGRLQIRSSDRTGKYTYASITEFAPNQYVGSDGRRVDFTYEIKEIKGKSKRNGYLVVKSSFQVLAKSKNPTYTNTVGYNDKTLLNFYDAQSYPVSCTYVERQNEPCRLETFSSPSGTTIFSYDAPIAGKREGATTVTHPDGAQTVYRFNNLLLLAAIENWFNGKLINKKTFEYDYKQHIRSIETLDGEGNLLLAKRFECDVSGNATLEKTEGDFGIFCIKRKFDKNRVTHEEYDDGLQYGFTYLGDTRLVTSKTTLELGKQLRKTVYSYDDANNLAQKEEMGKTRIVYILYQTGPHLHRVEWEEKTDWNGDLIHKVHYGYDGWGNTNKEEHFGSDGKIAYTIARTYNEKGELRDETNPVGEIASYEHDPRGRCFCEKPFSNGLVIGRTFDVKGRLKVLQEGDQETRFDYNASDELTEKTDYLGYTVTYYYDPVHGKPDRIEEPSAITEIVYDAFGREREKIDPYKAKTVKTYNSYGNIATITYPDGGKEAFDYFPNGLLKSHTDADGLVTAYAYDALGRTKEKIVGSSTTTFQYDGYDLYQTTDAEGFITEYQHDLAGRKVEEKRENRVTRYGYDSLGFLAWEERGERRTEYANDSLGRVRRKSIDGVLTTFWTYDGGGNVATIEQGGLTILNFDVHNRLTQKIDPEGHKTKIRYEKGLQLLLKKITDPMAIETVETYNPRQQLLKKEVAGQVVEEFEYDKLFRLKKQDHLTFGYTLNGKRQSIKEADIRTTNSTYTPGDRLVKSQKPDGTVLLHEYDAQWRLKKVGVREFRYDALDRLIGGTRFSRKLDAFGNIKREEWSNGLWIESDYDDWDRPLVRRLPDQTRIEYYYEGPFLKKVTRFSGNDTELYSHVYDRHDPRGNPRLSTGLFQVKYEYDRMGRKVHQHTPYCAETADYNPSGNLVKRGKYSYTYDSQSQMTSESGRFTAEYDVHYNLEKLNGQSIAIDALNQIEGLSYDLNGNLIRPGFIYDEFNQLTEAGGETYLYDSLGRRVQKGQTAFLYIGDEEIGAFEKGQSKELKIPGFTAPIAIEINQVPYAPIVDVQGITRFLIDWRTAELFKQNDCDAFGTGLSGEIPYAYAGKRYDLKTGLLYFGRRYYDPFLRRWLSPDPIGPEDHSNLYQYVFNNPSRYQDPTGENVLGLLYGIGQIALGGVLVVSGGALELITLGGYTFALGFHEAAGLALITSGCVQTVWSTKDLSFESRSTVGSYTASKNDPGSPQSREVQDKQFQDAVKEIEKQLGKKLNPSEVRELHDHVSGQGYGYHELVEEGYWLLGGS